MTHVENLKPHLLLATIKAIEGHDVGLIRSAIQTLIEATHQEPGCLYFYVSESAEQAGTFYLWEAWRGKQALADHYAAPHTQAYFNKGYTEVIEIKELRDLKEIINVA